MDIADKILITLKEIRNGTFIWNFQNLHDNLAMFSKSLATCTGRERIINMFIDFIAQLAVNGPRHGLTGDNKYLEEELKKIITLVWPFVSQKDNFVKLQILTFSIQRISQNLVQDIDKLFQNYDKDYRTKFLGVMSRIVFIYDKTQHIAFSDFMDLIRDLNKLTDLSIFSELQGFIQTTVFNSLKAIRYKLLYHSNEMLDEVKRSTELLDSMLNLNKHIYEIQLLFLKTKLAATTSINFKIVIFQCILEYINLGLLISSLLYWNQLQNNRSSPPKLEDMLSTVQQHYSYLNVDFDVLFANFSELNDANNNGIVEIMNQLHNVCTVYKKLSDRSNIIVLNMMIFASLYFTPSPKLMNYTNAIIRTQLIFSVNDLKNNSDANEAYLLLRYLYTQYESNQLNKLLVNVFIKLILPRFVSFLSLNPDSLPLEYLWEMLQTIKVEDLLHTCFFLLKSGINNETSSMLVEKIANYSTDAISTSASSTTIKLKLLHMEIIHLATQNGILKQPMVFINLDTLEQTLDNNKDALSPLTFIFLKHNIYLKRFSDTLRNESDIITVHSALRKMLVEISSDLTFLFSRIINLNLDFNTFIKILLDDYSNIMSQIVSFEREGKHLLIDFLSLLDTYKNLASIHGLENYTLVLTKSFFIIVEALFNSMKALTETAYLDLYFMHTKVDSYSVNHKFAIQVYQSRYKDKIESGKVNTRSLNTIELDCKLKELSFYNLISPIKGSLIR